MFEESFNGTKKEAAHARPPCPECVEIRQEIMLAALSETLVVAESVAIHIETCAFCRQWETEFKAMHARCRESECTSDPSRLTSSVLKSREHESERDAARRAVRGGGAEKASDRGALFVVLLCIILFQAMLALAMEGDASILYPVVCAAAMVLPTLWVYRDSTRRGIPALFWTALQPFTVPVGLLAYLICRQRASLRCPGCGAVHTSRNRFCPDCGGRLAETCCGCGRSVRKEFRICPFCGTRLEQCFPREDDAGRACGWSRRQIAFLVSVNVALVAGAIAVLLRGEAGSSFIATAFCLFGFLPIFNWVSFDSRRRAMNSVGWGLLALLSLYVGLVIYLACRKDERVACPVCGSHPSASFNYCPCCGSLLRASCAKCGASAAGCDRFCALCGAPLEITAAAFPRSPG